MVALIIDEEEGREELFEPFNPAGITASRLETIRYTLADGEEVCLQAVSVPDESGADSAYTTVWRLADQPDAPLDEEKVEAILSALGGYVTGQNTPAAGADPAACGFDAPLAAVTAWDGAGEHVLTYAEGTDGYYLMVEGDSLQSGRRGGKRLSARRRTENLNADKTGRALRAGFSALFFFLN